MLITKPQKFVIPLLLLAMASAFLFWLLHNPVADFSMSTPGLDNRPAKNNASSEQVIIGDQFKFYSNLSTSLTGKWPQFRGADFDNINKENIPLIDSWKTEDPKILWETELGEGHAAPVIYDGRVYILDYDETKKADALRCFALETGQELWKRSYKVHVKRNHGMSRTIPAVNDKYIVSIGPRGQVMCTDRINGDYLWGIDLSQTYNTEIPFWYTGQCPTIDNNVAIIAPGGSSLLIGVDCSNGKVLWETANPGNWQMSHSSIMPMEFAGKKMYVYAAVGGMCGISAEADDAGTLLWQSREFSPSVVAPSPLTFDDGKIFITAGYGAGGAMFQLKMVNNNFEIELLYKYKPKEGMASEQQTPVLIDGRMYGILPKDAGSFRNQFVCCDPGDCKTFIWTSGKSVRFGLGPYIYADKKFYIVDDNGSLTIARINNSGMEVLDQKRIIQGQDAWGPIAIADGYLLMRDSKKMVCMDVRK